MRSQLTLVILHGSVVVLLHEADVAQVHDARHQGQDGRLRLRRDGHDLHGLLPEAIFGINESECQSQMIIKDKK